MPSFVTAIAVGPTRVVAFKHETRGMGPAVRSVPGGVAVRRSLGESPSVASHTVFAQKLPILPTEGPSCIKLG
jgi:hypothetical protein